MTDEAKALVERLRSVDVSWSETGEWCAEAADRIETQARENERLREALELITREGGLAEYHIARAALTGDGK